MTVPVTYEAVSLNTQVIPVNASRGASAVSDPTPRPALVPAQLEGQLVRAALARH